MDRTNHIATNIITRGNMNISALTKGFILPFFTYEIRTKAGGSGAYKGASLYELERDLAEIRKKKEEVDAILVFVDWNKKVSRFGKEVYAELIMKKIEAELIKSTNEKYKITVQLINPEDEL
jgi:hypothetical protein